MSGVLLQPDGEFVPDLPYAETFVRVPGRHLKHGEATDLRNVLRLLDESNLCAQFDVCEPESAGTGAAGEIHRIVGRKDAAQGKDRVKLHPRNRAPVKLEGRSSRVDLRRSSVYSTKDVELIVMQVHRNRIVGLVRWPLPPQVRCGEQHEQDQSELRKIASDCLEHCREVHRFSWSFGK